MFSNHSKDKIRKHVKTKHAFFPLHICDSKNKKLTENYYVSHACIVGELVVLLMIYVGFFHELTTWKFLVSCCTKYSNRLITSSKYLKKINLCKNCKKKL